MLRGELWRSSFAGQSPIEKACQAFQRVPPGVALVRNELLQDGSAVALVGSPRAIFKRAHHSGSVLKSSLRQKSPDLRIRAQPRFEPSK